GSLLSDAEFARVAGTDLRDYYKVVLSDPTGLNFRNDIAHGLMDLSEMNQENVELILHLLLTLTRFKVDIPNGSE
ncbi:MAG: DUF4209 domain-containing protein, partial [Thermoplasmata archaeon]|nr:DUF4209 domain-containing protein [Thermoplasmata archaeon]